MPNTDTTADEIHHLPPKSSCMGLASFPGRPGNEASMERNCSRRFVPEKNRVRAASYFTILLYKNVNAASYHVRYTEVTTLARKFLKELSPQLQK